MAKPRILLIDDEVSFTNLMQINLEEQGYEVRVENRGAQGVETARDFQPQLIFLDVVMPDMDGGQLAAQILADEQLRHIPIVYLTAVVSKREEKAHNGIIGGNAFLAKPVSTEEILACIERSLAQGKGALDAGA